MLIEKGCIWLDNDKVVSISDEQAVNESCTNHLAFHTEQGTFSLISEPLWVPDSRISLQKIHYRFVPHTPHTMTVLPLSFQFMSGRSGCHEMVKKSFHWIPNIKNKPEQVAVEHTFRAPAVIVSADGYTAALLPDLNAPKQGTPDRFLDLRLAQTETDAPAVFTYGIGNAKTSGHVYYELDGTPFEVSGEGISLHAYLAVFKDCNDTETLRFITRFQWETFATPYESSILPQVIPFKQYADYGNKMALQYLWQEGPEPDTGGITLVTFKRNDGVFRGREYADDLWFHAWFNNMRTAMELAAFGEKEQAQQIARCLVSAPQQEGIFPTIYAPHDGGWIASSRDHGGGAHLYSLVDCAWSALWLRQFIREHGPVPNAERFLDNFRAFLCRAQNASGGFPCWVDANTLSIDPRLNDAAASALPLWFLGEELQLLDSTLPIDEYKSLQDAVVRGAEFIITQIIPAQRFEDFELYYSCSSKPLGYYDETTGLYGQNTLSIQWCAECLRVAYQLTNEARYLDKGLFCLSLLCLYQQVWNTPRLDFYTFGGFGVMNTDGEWNDARQAQFAETFMNYYDLTGDFEWIRRAVAAARAAFALMIIEENREICPRNYKSADHNAWRHGSSAENYGHGGNNEISGQSGFHWGVGSALVTAARIKQRYGDVLIDFKNRQAIGIDGLVVKDVTFDGEDISFTLEGLHRLEPLTFKMKKV